MTDLSINTWFIIILFTLIILWKLDFFTTLLNLKAFQSTLPSIFKDTISEEDYEISKEYNRVGSMYNIGSSVFSLAMLLVFWWLGGFGWLDGWVRSFGFGPIITGVIYIGLLVLASSILTLPLSLYSTFGIEAKFGFNRMSKALFFRDWVMSLVVSAILGIPLLMALLWVFQSVPHAWFWGWLITVAFMLVSVFLGPSVIMPLFNKFEPLEEGELKDEIFKMAKKCEFPVKEISIMDGSKRSSKSNAFFAGFGSMKKIVLFDTLVENHSVPELVSVLAHEIGHYKKRHIVKSLIIAVIGSGVTFFILGKLINNRGLFDAFAVKEVSIYVSLVLFGILFQPINQLLAIGSNWLSRKNEFEADAFARDAIGDASPMISALRKLSVDNKSNLTPHPWYVFLNYTHPPAVERIDALEKG